MNLRLTPAHPDGNAGLSFLAGGLLVFIPVLFAEGLLLADFVANRTFHHTETLLDFKWTLAVLIAIYVLIPLLPYVVFFFPLLKARSRGLREHIELSSRVINGTDPAGGAASRTSLEMSGVQALSDLAQSYGVVRGMRLLPFGLVTVILMVLAAAAPLLPLVLTVVPFEVIVDALIQMAF